LIGPAVLLDVDEAVFDAADHHPVITLLGMLAERRHDWHPSLSQAIAADDFVGRATAQLRLPAIAEWIQQAVSEAAFAAPSSSITTADVPVRVDELDDIVLDLGRPAVFLVEDKRADGTFIRTVAVALGAQHIPAALDKGWLRIGHGGGNSQMAWHVAEECRAFVCRTRVAALLDSDQARPGDTTTSTEQADEIRKAGLAAVHVWSWRTVENYIPFAAWEHHVARDRARMAELEKLRATIPAQRGRIKIREKLGKISPLIPAQVSVHEDDFAELGPTVVPELRQVLAMIHEIL
jgi:hypothetical protein